MVSTHSRPKAAVKRLRSSKKSLKFQHTAARRRLFCCHHVFACNGSFNTQPPEGGWWVAKQYGNFFTSFNTQPPEGGCLNCSSVRVSNKVSTHSRPKAAAQCDSMKYYRFGVSTHSRPKAAEKFASALASSTCFNTQPPEGGCFKGVVMDLKYRVSTHSRPKAADPQGIQYTLDAMFQHTAARRRLAQISFSFFIFFSFNTQPPEGGCFLPRLPF